MTFNTQRFAQELLEHRQKQRLTYRAAAEEIGITAGTLHRLEKGGKPHIDVFVSICFWAGWQQRAHFFFKPS